MGHRDARGRREGQSRVRAGGRRRRNMKVLLIAGFGPVVTEAVGSRKRYLQDLGPSGAQTRGFGGPWSGAPAPLYFALGARSPQPPGFGPRRWGAFFNRLLKRRLLCPLLPCLLFLWFPWAAWGAAASQTQAPALSTSHWTAIHLPAAPLAIVAHGSDLVFAGQWKTAKR